MAERFLTDFKRFFLYGLAAVLPTLLTLAIIFYVFTFLDNYLATYVNTWVLWLLGDVVFRTGPVHTFIVDHWWKHFWWVGFVLSLVGIYVFGRFVASWVGRSVWRMIEQAFFRLPLIRQIYPHVKQVTDFLFAEKKMKFTRVVVVENARKGVWSLGLVTGPGDERLCRALHHEEFLTVFVPSQPHAGDGIRHHGPGGRGHRPADQHRRRDPVRGQRRGDHARQPVAQLTARPAPRGRAGRCRSPR